MVVVCIVKDCATKEKNKEKLSLHTIPCGKRGEEWMKIIEDNGGTRKNLRNLGERASVCELHFTHDSYSSSAGKKRLLKDASPSVFKFPRLDNTPSK